VQSAQQLLKLVPAITVWAAAGKADTAPSTRVRRLAQHPWTGGVSSNSTLILIDGHRIPLTASSAIWPIPTSCRRAFLDRVE